MPPELAFRPSPHSPSASHGLPFDADAPLWSDVPPTHQDDGATPLCPILYAPAYSKAMDLLRTLLPRGEVSCRALSLTEHLVRLNPSNYTTWHYRAAILCDERDEEEPPPPQGIGRRKERLEKELDWVEELARGASLKNYQIWQHRRIIVVALGDPSRELSFVDFALGLDAKNYHTWAYRAWLLAHFGGLVDRGEPTPGAAGNAAANPPEGADRSVPKGQHATKDGDGDAGRFPNLWNGELQSVDAFLRDDCRNNSAWNHRWFCIFESGRAEAGLCASGGWQVGASLAECVEHERRFAEGHIQRTPHNASAWNYLRGLNRFATKATNPFTPSRALAAKLVDGKAADDDTPPLALEWLMDASAWEARHADAGERREAERAEAKQLLARLAAVDPIRRNYWRYRGTQLG